MLKIERLGAPEKSLLQLGTLKKLRELSVGNPTASSSTLAALRKALPQTTFNIAAAE